MNTNWKPDPDNFAEMVTPLGNVKRHIVCAANKYGELIVCGARHHDKIMNTVLSGLKESDVELAKRCEQGFIDQYGNFLSRADARYIVQVNKQSLRDEDLSGELFSENLY